MTAKAPHRTTLALWLALAFLGAPLTAATFVLTLRSGATFESRYKPKQAPWDASKVLIYSDVGNWLSLSRADIESVTNSMDNKGFGHALNTTTVELGWAPNDAMSPDELAKAMRENPGAFVAQGGAAPYSVNQFVEPGATQGIPLYTGASPLNSNFPLAGAGYLPGFMPVPVTTRPVSTEPVSPP